MPELSSLTLSASPIAYYKLESDGTDSSGSGNTLTVSGTPTFGTAKFGNGVTIDETTKTLEDSSATGLPTGTTNFTFVNWIKRTGTLTASSSGFSCIGARTDGNNFAAISPGSSNNNVRLSTWAGGTASYSTQVEISATDFTHVAFVRSNSGQTVKVYKDGNLVATDTITARNIGSASVIRIGEGYDWNCQFDDVAIFAAALTDADIQKIYGATRGLGLLGVGT